MSLQCIQEIEPRNPASGSSKASVVLATQWISEHVVLTGHLDGTLRAWNATENRLLAEEKAHASGISSLTVSSDGRKALTSSDDGSIRLWDVSGLKDSAAGGGAITSLASTSSVSSASAQGLASSTALHPSGAYFVSTGKGADVTVHSASSETFGAPLAVTPRLNAPTTSRIQPTGVKLRFSSAGDLLALGTDAGHVLLYQCPVPSPGTAASNDNTAAPTLRATSAAQSRPVTALAFDSLASTDASSAGHLFAGYDNGRIAMYDVSALSGSTASIDWNPITYLRGHKAPVSDLATVALPEGSNLAPTSGASSLLLASISPGDGALRLWDVGGAAKVCISTTKLDRKKHAPLPSNGKGESSSPGPPPPPPQLDEATDTLSTLSSSLSLLLQIGSQSLYRLSSSTHLQINPSIPPHVHMASSAAGLVEPQEMKGDIKELVEDFMDRAGSIKEGIAMLGVERTEEEHVAELKRLDKEMHQANEEYAEALKEAESVHKEVQALLLQSCTSSPLGDKASKPEAGLARRRARGSGAWAISWRPASGPDAPVLVVPGPDGGVRLYAQSAASLVAGPGATA